ncbi:hypothetical protein EJ110_NYTH09760, partial [Nymphaea thermarum]
DLETGNWNLSFNGETVGFWLRTNYHSDFDLADQIQWGGEIVNKRTNGRHTGTQMGSGHFGREGLLTSDTWRCMTVTSTRPTPLTLLLFSPPTLSAMISMTGGEHPWEDPDNYASHLYNVHLRRPEQNNLVFTQVGRRYFPGGAICATSDYDGRQKELDLEIKKDFETGNWKLSINGETVGFWMRTNYHPDFHLADEIQWGGEIADERINGRHTSTQMGSGHFGREGLLTSDTWRCMTVTSTRPTPLTLLLFLPPTLSAMISMTGGEHPWEDV